MHSCNVTRSETGIKIRIKIMIKGAEAKFARLQGNKVGGWAQVDGIFIATKGNGGVIWTTEFFFGFTRLYQA